MFLLFSACWATDAGAGPVPQDQSHNLDFEDGLRGWEKSGAAFDSQPVTATSIRTNDIVAMPLGGDYWRNQPYPLGSHLDSLIRTTDPLRGSLLSGEITLDRRIPYFSLLVGGGSDLERVRVELRIPTTSTNDRTELEQRIRASGAQPITEGSDLIVFRTTGSLTEVLRQEVFRIPDFLFGRTGRIRIVDDGAGKWDHINVDYLQFTEQPPVYQAPVWGLADYHSHPMAHIGFGALNGVRTYWGVPGGAYKDYENDGSLIRHDIPVCNDRHDGGPTAPLFINAVEQRFRKGGLFHNLLIWIRGNLTSHWPTGPTHFHNFPTFLSGSHQSMHVTQIRRSFEGGLRLLTAIAVHNRGVEFLASPVRHGRVKTSTEKAVLEAQVCATEQLARANSDWMEIAYTPEQARDIIIQGKLAVVLAVEMDELGRLLGDSTSISEEVQYLWNLGIRQVTPIHGVNNRLGGPAIFEPTYNTLNDFLNRGEMSLRRADLRSRPPEFFQVREGGCASPVPEPLRGECVLYRFNPTQERVVLKKFFPVSLFRVAPYLEDARVRGYEGFDGHLNENGLTADGATYIREMMRRGMLVDLAHMSERSVAGVYQVIGSLLVEQGHSECREFGQQSSLPDSCFDRAYPLMVSHAHFRALAIQDRGKTTHTPFLPQEYEISERQLEILRRIGGIIGPFVTEDPVDPPPGLTAPFANDCAMSSKSFGYSYRYALQKMDRKGVGIATDITFISGTSPRFGNNACWAYHFAKDPKKEKALSPGQYRDDQQVGGIVYADRSKRGDVRYGANTPLRPYKMGARTYDFNLDGFANYGMMPDLLQDLKNLGLDAADFQALFSSADGYLQSWEKARRVAGCDAGKCPFTKLQLACDTVCNGLCPDSPKAGAPKAGVLGRGR